MNRIRLLHSSRSLLFDKQKFFAAKRLFKAQKDVENTTFKDALKCLSTYSLGQDAVATIHVKVQRDSFKPVRGDVTLPKAPSTTPDAKSTILVFAEGELAEKAKALGAHIVGGEELIADIVQDKLIFHKFPHVVKIARHLGPKGLMPSPARGTVSDDIEGMMATLKASQKYEADDDGFIHFDIARTTWNEEEIRENISEFLKSLDKVKPAKTTLLKFVSRIGVSAQFTPGVIFPRKELINELYPKTEEFY